jgi:hypothetical protein
MVSNAFHAYAETVTHILTMFPRYFERMTHPVRFLQGLAVQRRIEIMTRGG